MQQNSDLIELLVALNAAGAEYLLIGAYAVAFYGHPRATKDVNIFVGTDPSNAKKVWAALLSFGAPLGDLKLQDLETPETYFIMGRPPNQIDIITSIDGVTFRRAWETRVSETYQRIPVNFIGRAELITNKRETGRPQDIADIASLAALSGKDGTNA